MTMSKEKRKSERSGRPKKGSSRQRRAKQRQEQVSTSFMFRKVARDQIAIEDGGKRIKISYWDAYVRKLYAMALKKNTSAARLLEQLRRQFPGNLLPGDPIYFVIYPEDVDL
jgi:hypothetical protein